MNYQIEIQFTGQYQIDADTNVTDPLVIAVAATDDFISNVAIACLFNAPIYSYYRNIGSFTYTTTWGNIQVENYINTFMQNCKI